MSRLRLGAPRLFAAERAVFLLHEVFDYESSEIAEVIGKSPANCRQLLHRAQANVAERRRRFEPSREAQLIERFQMACQEGDTQGLMDMLARDVVNWSDGGGKALAARRPIYGAEAVARFWLALAQKTPADLAVTLEEVNGGPAVLLWVGGELLSVVTFEVTERRIAGIRCVLNPDKLAYLLRQLEAGLI